MTEKEFQELNSRIGSPVLDDPSIRPPRRFVAPKPNMFEGPISMTMTLYGHCPSKKNGWKSSGNGKLFIPSEMKVQIDTLTTQALFQWGMRGPIQHPNMTVQFFVAAARQDEDGMWTTVLDCLQKAGVLVNDNIAHFNGRKVHEPCVFVPEADERVEITVSRA